MSVANTPNTFQIKTVFALAAIFAFRMLGLFMILPVFSLYAHHLHGATPALIGLALGIYGLTQAGLQIPLGTLSDRIGRKPVIIGGLVAFGVGSIVAACSTSITGIIIGRALQGAGAIGSTTIALTADLTSEKHRTKAMAVIGLTIGISFSIAMVLGPIVNSFFHLSGIFWLTALLAGLGILITAFVVPTPTPPEKQNSTTGFWAVLKNPALAQLNVGIFVQHAILTASFIALPLVLTHQAGFASTQQWLFYLPLLATAFLMMVPFIILAEKKGHMKAVFTGAILVIALSQLALHQFHSTLTPIAVALLCFFAAFSLLEALLPSLVSKTAPPERKGAAMGIYSTSQFLGIFVGGSLGGTVLTHFGITGVFLFCAILGILWFSIAVGMQNSNMTKSIKQEYV